jgi:hypothetical protein
MRARPFSFTVQVEVGRLLCAIPLQMPSMPTMGLLSLSHLLLLLPLPYMVVEQLTLTSKFPSLSMSYLLAIFQRIVCLLSSSERPASSSGMRLPCSIIMPLKLWIAP